MINPLKTFLAAAVLENRDDFSNLLEAFDRLLYAIIKVILAHNPAEFSPHRPAMEKYHAKYQKNCKKILKEYSDTVRRPT